GRPGQVEEVRDPGGQHGGGAAEEAVRGVVAAGGVPDLPVVGLCAADEHPAGQGRLGADRVPGVLQGAPRLGEEQPLLGVHVLGLERGHAEEGRVERVDAGEGGGPFARRGPGAPLRVGVGGGVPAVGRDLSGALPPGGQVGPEAVQRRRVGEPAGHPDHRDGVLVVLLRGGRWRVGGGDGCRCGGSHGGGGGAGRGRGHGRGRCQGRGGPRTAVAHGGAAQDQRGHGGRGRGGRGG